MNPYTQVKISGHSQIEFSQTQLDPAFSNSFFFFIDKLENIQERLSNSDISDDESISRSYNQDELDGTKSEEEKSLSESDILAELNSNLAKIAEKDKDKKEKKVAKKAMFAVTVEDTESVVEEEPKLQINIHPSRLLKVCPLN